MTSSRVVMLVKNSFQLDARVQKEARTLADSGRHVTVVALHVPGVTPRREQFHPGVDVVRVRKPSFGATWLDRRLRSAANVEEQSARGSKDDATKRSSGALPLDHTATPETDLQESGGRWTRVAAGPLLRLQPLISRQVPRARQVLRPVRDRVLDTRMHRAAMQANPSVVHAHDLNTLAVGRACAQALDIPLIYDSHELHGARAGSTASERASSLRLERQLIGHADAVIMVSDGCADELTRLHPVARPTVVRNVPDHVPKVEPIDLRSAVGLDADQRLLVYCGAVLPERGIEQTIAALEHHPSTALAVIGHGTHRPALEQLAVDAGVASRVRFFGPVPQAEMLRYAASADAGICCIVGTADSYRYSLPNKLFEYWQAGLPVIASDLPDIGAAVRSTQAGLLCDPTNPSSVSNAIDELFSEEERFEAMRSAARAAATEFNWAVEQQRLLAVYEFLDR